VAKEKRVPGSSPGGMIEAVLGFPDEPQVKVQPCPECGGEVKIGLVGTLKLGDGAENWVENGTAPVAGSKSSGRSQIPIDR
jgi:hypothetical protein